MPFKYVPFYFDSDNFSIFPMAKAVKKEETEVIRESDASHDWSQANSKDEMFLAEGWDPILDR